MKLKSFGRGLTFVFLVTLAVQCVNAQQQTPQAWATFKNSKKYANHPNGRDHTDQLGPDHPALNYDDVFATGLDGLEFRIPIQMDVYDPLNGFEVTMVSELLYEITVRDKEDKLVLDPPTRTQGQPYQPGELVIIDYKVTLLDSQWASQEFYFEEDWDWEDEDSLPEITPLDHDWTYASLSIGSQFEFLSGEIHLVGFTEVGDHPEYRAPEYCDYGIRFHNGLFHFIDPDSDPNNDHCIEGDNALVLPGASYKGTLVVEFIGNCLVDPSIEFASTAELTTATNRATLYWEYRQQLLGAAPFYKDSSYDNDEFPTTAIAPDKEPFYDGDLAQFENLTSFNKGLNGIVIDIRNQVCHGDATLDDFVFKTGLDNTPGDWPLAKDPRVRTQMGGGVGGADRIWLTWEDEDVLNTWLQVQMPGVETESGQDATFYFGNLVGETGDLEGEWPDGDEVVQVGVFDLLKFRRDYHSPFPANIESVSDFDRSGGDVGIFDLLIFRSNYRNSIPRITPQSN